MFLGKRTRTVIGKGRGGVSKVQGEEEGNEEGGG